MLAASVAPSAAPAPLARDEIARVKQQLSATTAEIADLLIEDEALERRQAERSKAEAAIVSLPTVDRQHAHRQRAAVVLRRHVAVERELELAEVAARAAAISSSKSTASAARPA